MLGRQQPPDHRHQRVGGIDRKLRLLEVARCARSRRRPARSPAARSTAPAPAPSASASPARRPSRALCAHVAHSAPSLSDSHSPTDRWLRSTTSGHSSRGSAPSSISSSMRCDSVGSRSGGRYGAMPSSAAVSATWSSSLLEALQGRDRAARGQVDQLARHAPADRPPHVLLEVAAGVGGQRLAGVEAAGEVGGQRHHQAGQRHRARELGLPVADPGLDGGIGLVWAHAPPDLRVLADRARIDQEADELGVLIPAGEAVGDAAAREELGEDLGAGGVQVRVAPLQPGRAAGEGEQLRQHRAKRAVDGDRTVGAVDADVHVQAERVVAPGHVAQGRLDDRVVRRVDHLLVLPARVGMRAGGAQPVAEVVGHIEQIGPPLGHGGGRLREAVALAGPDLDLAADQLPRHHLSQRRVLADGHREPLEAGRHLQRGRLEDRELLLDRDGEVLGLLELDARVLERRQRVGDLGRLSHAQRHDTRAAAACGRGSG